jgi:hypothetical protein
MKLARAFDSRATHENTLVMRSSAVNTGKMKAREWREQRFVEEGVAALRRYLAAIGKADALPPTGEYYVCPCCMRVHGREALGDGALTTTDRC